MKLQATTHGENDLQETIRILNGRNQHRHNSPCSNRLLYQVASMVDRHPSLWYYIAPLLALRLGFPGWKPQPSSTWRYIAQFTHFAHVHLQYNNTEKVAILSWLPVPRCRRNSWLVHRRVVCRSKDECGRCRSLFRFPCARPVGLHLNRCRTCIAIFVVTVHVHFGRRYDHRIKITAQRRVWKFRPWQRPSFAGELGELRDSGPSLIFIR